MSLYQTKPSAGVVFVIEEKCEFESYQKVEIIVNHIRAHPHAQTNSAHSQSQRVFQTEYRFKYSYLVLKRQPSFSPPPVG